MFIEEEQADSQGSLAAHLSCLSTVDPHERFIHFLSAYMELAGDRYPTTDRKHILKLAHTDPYDLYDPSTVCLVHNSLFY